MTLGWIIIVGYTIIGMGILDRATNPKLRGCQRAMLACMGVAVIAFAVGRYLYAVGEGLNLWLFNIGHFSFFGFAAIYFLCASNMLWCKGHRDVDGP